MELDSTTHCWSMLLFHSTIFVFHLASLHHSKFISSTPCLTIDCWGQVFAMHCYFVLGSTREESNIMLALPSTPCWYSSMIWWGGQSSKWDRGRGVMAPRTFFLCCTKILCAPHCSWCCPQHHLTFPYYIKRYTTSTSIDGSRLHYTLPIHPWPSYI